MRFLLLIALAFVAFSHPLNKVTTRGVGPRGAQRTTTDSRHQVLGNNVSPTANPRALPPNNGNHAGGGNNGNGVGNSVNNANNPNTPANANSYGTGTPAPTHTPTKNPTAPPTPNPTAHPTPAPTNPPTPSPTNPPSPSPTNPPSPSPTNPPSPSPTNPPSPSPTNPPTPAPVANTAFVYNTDISWFTSQGYTLCWSTLYGDWGPQLSDIQALPCMQSASFVFLAGRETGSNTILLGAGAPKSIVYATSGSGQTCEEAVAGSQSYLDAAFWYSTSCSMGFYPAGNIITLQSCDTQDSSFGIGGTGGAQRLCWHTGGGENNGGWRLGYLDWLNSDTAHEKLIFTKP